MITLGLWLLGIFAYFCIGMTLAQSQSKATYRAKREEFNHLSFTKREAEVQKAYHLSLASWVFAWPVRLLSALISFTILYLILMPSTAFFSWVADTAKGPVTKILRDGEQAEREAKDLAQTLRTAELDEEEEKILKQALELAYRKQQIAAEELGLPTPGRIAIEASSATYLQEAAERASRSAEYPVVTLRGYDLADLHRREAAIRDQWGD